MSEPLRIWWNKNLHGKISPGKLAAHAAHAALRAYGIEYDHPIVVLAAGKGRIEAMPITIHDEGRTELEPGTLTTGIEDTSRLAWLAAHDARVRAETLREAAQIALEIGRGASGTDQDYGRGYAAGAMSANVAIYSEAARIDPTNEEQR